MLPFAVVFHGEHKASVKNFQPASPGVPKRLTAELCDLGGVCWLVGKRDRRVMLLDHARKLGEKIRISGGGRCIHAPEAFCRSKSVI